MVYSSGRVHRVPLLSSKNCNLKAGGTGPSTSGIFFLFSVVYSVCIVYFVCTYILTIVVSFTWTAEELPPQQVAIVLQEGQIKVPEKLHMLVLHPQLLRRVPVDHLDIYDNKRITGKFTLTFFNMSYCAI